MLTKNFSQLKAEVQRHIAADSVAQGSYSTCFVGCLANQSDDPQYIESTYGIPRMVSRIAESIFEGLPENTEASAFFAALPKAVGCDGKDLSRVPWQFLAKELNELKSLPTVEDEIQSMINTVIKGMNLLGEGKEWPEGDARAASDAASNTAWAAASNAVWAASDAASDAARAAASDAVRRRQRDLLLKLISEAPVVSAEGK